MDDDSRYGYRGSDSDNDKDNQVSGLDIYGDPVEHKEAESKAKGYDSDSDHNEYTNRDIDIDLPVAKPTLRISMATNICLHRYAMDRITAAISDHCPWPPLMFVIFRYIDKGLYRRTNLINERNLAMLELLLDVPIQLVIRYRSGHEIDLNEFDSFDPHGAAFVEARVLLNDLIVAKVIEPKHVRRFRVPVI